MMKNKNGFILSLLIATSMCVIPLRMQANNNVAGIIGTIGAVLLGAAGIATAIDYCFSETDEQLIARSDREYNSFVSQYNDSMYYLRQLIGINAYSSYVSIGTISETALFEFATYTWNRNISQSTYRSEVHSAKNKTQSNITDLMNRIKSLERKKHSYHTQQNLMKMRALVSKLEVFLSDITVFSDCLEHHKTYFTLYDLIGNIRNRYIHELMLLEEGHYSAAIEIKRYIVSKDSNRYAFKNYVRALESDISQLNSALYNLRYTYDSGRSYAEQIANYLLGIKNIVVLDPRYQQELYEYEQERIREQELALLKEQARLERDRVKAMHEQNRILSERNRIEQQRLYQERHVEEPEIRVDFSVIL